MGIIIKVTKSGDKNRRSRLHTLRGELIPVQEIISLPVEVLLRLLRIKRKGPWISRQAINQINLVLSNLKEPRILEIGGGHSSKYLSERVGFLRTLEEDSTWEKTIRNLVTNPDCDFKVDIINLENWLKNVTASDLDFDIIIIDGGTDANRKRAIEFLPTLNRKALYVLDNSDRKIFVDTKYKIAPVKIVRTIGLIRNPLQATETSFLWFS